MLLYNTFYSLASVMQRIKGADHLTFEGGGGVILKKNFLQGHSEQKKIPALTN